MVKIRATAKGRILAVEVDESLLAPSEKTMVEDLVAAAINDARAKADQRRRRRCRRCRARSRCRRDSSFPSKPLANARFSAHDAPASGEAPMTLGAMQDFPLRIMRLMDHAEREHGSREIVAARADGSTYPHELEAPARTMPGVWPRRSSGSASSRATASRRWR